MVTRRLSFFFSNLSCLVVLIFAGLTLGDVSAQDLRDERDLNTQKLLAELEQIELRRESLFLEGLNSRAQDIRSQTSTERRTIDYWKKAIKATEYEGIPEGGKKYAEWEDKKTEIHLDPLFKQAVMLHTNYLILTLSRLNGAEDNQVMPALLNHVEELDALLVELEEREMPVTDQMQQRQRKEAKKLRAKGHEPPLPKHIRTVLKMNLTASPIVKWQQLDQHFKNLKNWEMTPGNIDGILDSSIMPNYRVEGDSRLLSLWDARINRAYREASKENLASKVQKYESETRPKLEWSKAQDMALLGYSNKARLVMMDLIRNNPSHPEFKTWVTELRDRLGSPDGLTGKQRDFLAKNKKKSPATQATEAKPPQPPQDTTSDTASTSGS